MSGEDPRSGAKVRGPQAGGGEPRAGSEPLAGGRAGQTAGAQVQKTVEDRLSDLERRMDCQEQTAEDLDFRINAKLTQVDLDKVVAYIKTEFAELEHVVAVHYAVLEDGTWYVVAIHDLDDVEKPLMTICAKCIKVEDEFDNVHLDPLILHEDEVDAEHLVGTRPVFLRTR